MGDWWMQGTPGQIGFVRSCQLAGGAVETDTLAAQNVTSEKLSDNALQRSLIVPLPDLAKGASLSCTYVLMRPLVPVTIQRVQLLAQTSWFAATSETNQFDLFNNASSTMAQYIVGTGTIAQGDRVDLGTLTNAGLGACVDLTLKLAVGACSNPGAQALQLDYKTTG